VLVGAAMSVAQTLETLDGILKRMESALRCMHAAQGSVVKLPQTELDLLKQFEDARNLILSVLKGESKNREVLRGVFGGDCTRISRIRAVLESAKFSEMNAGDQRPLTCLKACESVEEVLKDLGLEPALARAQREQREALYAFLVDVEPETCGAELKLMDAPVNHRRLQFADNREPWDACSSEPDCELKVEVLGASELHVRLAERFLSSDVDHSAMLPSIYVELLVANQTKRTLCSSACSAGGRSVTFQDESFTFKYHSRRGEELVLRIFDQRETQTDSKTDALVGEATWPLGPELNNFLPPRKVELQVMNAGTLSGKVSLRYQAHSLAVKPQRHLKPKGTFIGNAQ